MPAGQPGVRGERQACQQGWVVGQAAVQARGQGSKRPRPRPRAATCGARDAEGGELALHRAQPVGARQPQVLERVVDDRGHAHRGHQHDLLERVVHRLPRQQLRRRDVEPAEVVLDIALHAAQRGAVEGPAGADQAQLLEQALGLRHLARG